MGSSKHSNAPWRKAILIPFWIIQICTLVGQIGISVLALGVIAMWNDDEIQNNLSYYDDNGNKVTTGDFKTATKIIVPVWIAISSVCLFVTFLEIVLLALNRLKPIVFIIINAFKTVAWTVAFVTTILGISRQDERLQTGITIGLNVIVLIAFWIPFIYGIIVFFRNRKGKEAYASVDKPLLSQETSFSQQYNNHGMDDPIAPVAHPDAPRERRLSYNHTRDTGFESFRRSLSNPSSPNAESTIHYKPYVPQVVVENHDLEANEMDAARQNLR